VRRSRGRRRSLRAALPEAAAPLGHDAPRHVYGAPQVWDVGQWAALPETRSCGTIVPTDSAPCVLGGKNG
jgi:hypothetical protein